MSLYLGENLISGVATPTEPTRNLGQIIESIVPLTDAGLHLLDGTLINGSGIYADFVTAIGDLVSTYPDLFETEANWQTSVTTYGVCGKFVYDSVANTVRLPKITGILEGTTDLTALGDLVKAGLPSITHTHTRGTMNITGSFNNALGMIVNQPINGTGAFANGGYSQSTSRSGTGDNYWQSVNTVSFTASNSWTGSTSNNSAVSSIYGNSSTVQPQTIKVLYYIVIATSTKTDIQVDIDEIATDLNGKADTDLTNVTDTGYIKIAHNAMPSTEFIDLTLGASGTTYTAPADGYVYFQHYTDTGGAIAIYCADSQTHGYIGSRLYSPSNGSYLCTTLPVSKGRQYIVTYSGTSTSGQYFRFVYAVGSESEAS